MGIDADLAAGGIPYPLAQELIAATKGTATTAARLSGLGVSGPLAIELAAQLNGGTKNVAALMSLGFPGGAATALAAAGGGSSLLRLPLNSRIVVTGDSYPDGNSSPSIIWPSLAFAGGRFFVPIDGKQAVGGYTLRQILDRLVTDNGSLAKAVTLSPKVLWNNCLINDIRGGASAATCKLMVQEYFDRVRATSPSTVYVVFGTIPPFTLGNTGAIEAIRSEVNTFIKTFDRTVQGGFTIRTYDYDAMGLNPATDSADGLHYDRIPVWAKIAPVIGALLSSLISTDSILWTTDPTDGGRNLLTNPQLAGTIGVGQTATNWVAGQNGLAGVTVTPRLEVDSDGYNRQVIAMSGTSTSAGFVLHNRSPNTYAGAIGDALEAIVKVKFADLVGFRGFQILADANAGIEGNTAYLGPIPNCEVIMRTMPVALTGADTSTNFQTLLYGSSGITFGGELGISRPNLRKVPLGL